MTYVERALIQAREAVKGLDKVDDPVVRSALWTGLALVNAVLAIAVAIGSLPDALKER